MIGHPERSAYLEWVHTVARVLRYCPDEITYTPGYGYYMQGVGNVDKVVMFLAKMVNTEAEYDRQ